MAGRPSKAYTMEEIEAKLEPCAQRFLYVPEEKARTSFLSSERARILEQEPSFFDPETTLPKKEYIETVLQICLYGATSEHFKKLHQETQAELLQLEAKETPLKYKFRNNLELLAQSPEARTTVKQLLNNAYNSTKFINCFYKWVLTEPQNGAPNFCSCFTDPKYPSELIRIIGNAFITKCDHIAFFTIDKQPTKQSELYKLIKEYLLNELQKIINLASIGKWYYPLTKSTIEQYLEVLQEIATALRSVTWENISKRPNTSKKENEQSLFTGKIITFDKGGYYPFLEDFDKLNEKDAKINYIDNLKVYESQNSNLKLEILLSDSNAEKNSATSKIVRTLTYLIKQDETIRKTCEMEISKEAYMGYMRLTEEQKKDAIYKQNFFAKQLRQFAFLRSVTGTIIEGIGKGRVGGILDYAEIGNKIIRLRFNREFMTSLFLNSYPYQPCTLEANKIPDRLPIEYFLHIKLENLFTNIRRQATNKEEYIQLKHIIKHLGKHRVLNPEEKKYKEKLCNRLIQALDYLQNINQSIEYYLTTTPDGTALEGPELERYKNRTDFPNLYIWFNIPALEDFIDPEQARDIIQRFNTHSAKRKERRERAQDNEYGKLKAKDQYNAEQQQEQAEDTTKTPDLSDFFKIQ